MSSAQKWTESTAGTFLGSISDENFSDDGASSYVRGVAVVDGVDGPVVVVAVVGVDSVWRGPPNFWEEPEIIPPHLYSIKEKKTNRTALHMHIMCLMKCLTGWKGVPHHLLGTVDWLVEFTSKDFRDSATLALDPYGFGEINVII
ncbi:hypothetical protein Droror1_Dr00005548 [Drosera rotundifolia]